MVVGPTASGKTALAVRLAEESGGEIISADSVQVYRGFDIGSGKPTPEEQRRARHHLVDVLDPLEPIDAARWAEAAEAALGDIRARGRLPIVCGGSFLWVRALLFGLAPAPPADEALRAAHRARAAREGRAALHRELALVDSVTAARLDPNDLVRVSRALEVHALTGKALSLWHAEHGFREARHRAALVGVGHPRERLHARIEARVTAMLASGWEEEVERLLAEGFAEARAMRAVGYRQVREALGERASASSASSASSAPASASLSERIAQATRVFARQQRTWLRDEPVRWLTPEEAATVTAEELLASAPGRPEE